MFFIAAAVYGIGAIVYCLIGSGDLQVCNKKAYVCVRAYMRAFVCVLFSNLVTNVYEYICLLLLNEILPINQMYVAVIYFPGWLTS